MSIVEDLEVLNRWREQCTAIAIRKNRVEFIAAQILAAEISTNSYGNVHVATLRAQELVDYLDQEFPLPEQPHVPSL